MSNSKSGQLQVALDALHSDADVWSSAAGELHAAALKIAQLQLTGWDVSYIADKAGVTDAYSKLQEKMVRLLQEGAKNLDSTAHALNECAAEYGRSDAHGVNELGKVHQEMPR